LEVDPSRTRAVTLKPITEESRPFRMDWPTLPLAYSAMLLEWIFPRLFNVGKEERRTPTRATFLYADILRSGSGF
jgi:hypothetical protein